MKKNRKEKEYATDFFILCFFIAGVANANYINDWIINLMLSIHSYAAPLVGIGLNLALAFPVAAAGAYLFVKYILGLKHILSFKRL